MNHVWVFVHFGGLFSLLFSFFFAFIFFCADNFCFLPHFFVFLVLSVDFHFSCLFFFCEPFCVLHLFCPPYLLHVLALSRLFSFISSRVSFLFLFLFFPFLFMKLSFCCVSVFSSSALLFRCPSRSNFHETMGAMGVIQNIIMILNILDSHNNRSKHLTDPGNRKKL